MHNKSRMSTKKIMDLISQKQTTDGHFGSLLCGDFVKFRATSDDDGWEITAPLKRNFDAFINVDIFGPRQRLLISCRTSDNGR